MERRLAVHARAHRQALRACVAIAALVSALPAVAAPKTADAKAAFDRGVAAYQRGEFAAAADALGASFALESDVETLFAWAQTERQLAHCDKAVELYGKLLAYDLPAENKAAIRVKLDECRAILAQATPKPEPPPPPVTPAPAVAASPAQPAHTDEPQPTGGRAWWKDPVGDTFVGLGVVGIGVGAVMLVSARSADADKAHAATYGEFQMLEDKATSRGKLGVISASAGGALIVVGVIWYATHGDSERRTQVTGWLTPDGGGLAALGRF